MRTKIPYTYFILFFALLSLMSFPKESTERLRGTAIAVMAPSWNQLLSIKNFFNWNTAPNAPRIAATDEEIQKLQLDNTLLHTEIIHLKEIIQQEMQLLMHLNELSREQTTQQTTTFIKKRRRLELQKLLQLKAVPARVIFRSSAAWNNSLWIDVGEFDNKNLNEIIIAKNSPVLIGNSIIGVIDYVGKRQARVLLITDASITPSVRALRDDSKTLLASEKIQTILHLFETTKTLSENQQEQKQLLNELQKTSNESRLDYTATYLAKGEVHGSGKPLWRSNRHLLKGIGFNYDFADGEGPARDLRTGAPIDSSIHLPSTPILKSGDLLVTTGMDGVFPPNLLVAEITKVHMLKEGDYYYELDAQPTAGNFDDLTTVFVLPPIGYDPDEHPHNLAW